MNSFDRTRRTDRTVDRPPVAQVSPLVTVLHVVVTALVGTGILFAVFYVGVTQDQIGIMSAEPANYPRENAWMWGAYVAGILCAAGTWWGLHAWTGRARS